MINKRNAVFIFYYCITHCYKLGGFKQPALIISQFPGARVQAQVSYILCSEPLVAEIKEVARLLCPLEFRVLFQVHVDVGGISSSLAASRGYS